MESCTISNAESFYEFPIFVQIVFDAQNGPSDPQNNYFNFVPYNLIFGLQTVFRPQNFDFVLQKIIWFCSAKPMHKMLHLICKKNFF